MDVSHRFSGWRSAYGFFVLIWLAAVGYLALAGAVRSAAFAGGIGLYLVVMMVLTFRLTRSHAPPGRDLGEGVDRPQRPFGQAAVALLFILLSFVRSMAFHGTLPFGLGESALGTFLAATTRLTYATNPLLYFVLPATLLALIGVDRRQVGLGPGFRSGRVLALWSALPLLIPLVAMVTGQRSPWAYGLSLVSNALQNGFFEEYLFRGVLQGSLQRLLDAGWAVVVTALLFGIWHLGGTTAAAGGDWMMGLASSIAFQGTLGLAFGVVAQRTRNLLAPSVAHVLMNASGL